MTRLPSRPSLSSSEASSPLNLDSGLTARLQAASFQPLATDCTVLLDSEFLRVGVPFLLSSSTEEELVSFTDSVNYEVVGDGYDTGQLLQQPSKSKNE